MTIISERPLYTLISAASGREGSASFCIAFSSSGIDEEQDALDTQAP